MFRIAPVALAFAGALFSAVTIAASPWAGNLTPIAAADWNRARAAHLLERAGFGGTPEEIDALARLTPAQAVRRMVYFEGAPAADLPPFDHSGVFEAGLDPFPASRPATTDLARDSGEALGVTVKAGGNRRMQPVVNKFFYWLRASKLETDRVAYWWANRMLTSPRPLQEKMALFWHGHFATNEDKVRDYRKMLNQLELFQNQGLGKFRTLMIGVAQDPAMLSFLDAAVNVKGAPNENFAREIMELFTMGVGHYSEHDIREAARAFTGWNYQGVAFHIDAAKHDGGPKAVLGRRGNYDGVQVIDIILDQPVTPRYLASKLYRHFVREDIDPALAEELGRRLKAVDYDIAAFLEMLFMSRDFHAPESVATRIKGPVELVVSTYRKLGLTEVPGVPDFNETTTALGQRLMHPPTVAGWAQGRSWITPGLLLERGNFALDVALPDINYIPGDRYPGAQAGYEIRNIHERVRSGLDLSTATKPGGADGGVDMMATSSMNGDRDEDFNTRYGSYRGWQMAVERVKPIPRTVARLDLTGMVLKAGCSTPEQVVSYMEGRFLSVQLDVATRAKLAAFLEKELGTRNVPAAASYAEDPLRLLLHVLLSRPEYQLG
ncbi:DUF1800 domain-containing protein [Methyloversatilis discipulorum]|uniref:DUF1800 domain-containing protein n=1 Tax=Methyloversatilis discipulorum TaxID=1119528 RepID=UPI00037A54AF|nr:DUF1800 domain-containing protein [Methyloversatilis discipulorum]